MIRFEDLLFNTEEVVTKVCTCGGGVMGEKFRYIQENAKPKQKVHEGASGMVKALMTYSNMTARKEIFLPQDLDYASKALRNDIIELFNYQIL